MTNFLKYLIEFLGESLILIFDGFWVSLILYSKSYFYYIPILLLLLFVLSIFILFFMISFILFENLLRSFNLTKNYNNPKFFIFIINWLEYSARSRKNNYLKRNNTSFLSKRLSLSARLYNKIDTKLFYLYYGDYFILTNLAKFILFFLKIYNEIKGILQAFVCSSFFISCFLLSLFLFFNTIYFQDINYLHILNFYLFEMFSFNEEYINSPAFADLTIRNFYSNNPEYVSSLWHVIHSLIVDSPSIESCESLLTLLENPEHFNLIASVVGVYPITGATPTILRYYSMLYILDILTNTSNTYHLFFTDIFSDISGHYEYMYTRFMKKSHMHVDFLHLKLWYFIDSPMRLNVLKEELLCNIKKFPIYLKDSDNIKNLLYYYHYKLKLLSYRNLFGLRMCIIEDIYRPFYLYLFYGLSYIFYTKYILLILVYLFMMFLIFFFPFILINLLLDMDCIFVMLSYFRAKFNIFFINSYYFSMRYGTVIYKFIMYNYYYLLANLFFKLRYSSYIKDPYLKIFLYKKENQYTYLYNKYV